jgi:hypothetical protein
VLQVYRNFHIINQLFFCSIDCLKLIFLRNLELSVNLLSLQMKSLNVILCPLIPFVISTLFLISFLKTTFLFFYLYVDWNYQPCSAYWLLSWSVQHLYCYSSSQEILFWQRRPRYNCKPITHLSFRSKLQWPRTIKASVNSRALIYVFLIFLLLLIVLIVMIVLITLYFFIIFHPDWALLVLLCLGSTLAILFGRASDTICPGSITLY